MEETNNSQTKENTKIKHVKKRLKQNKKPICGIYAFLNGFFAVKFLNNSSVKNLCDLNKKFKNISVEDINNVVSDMWYEAVAETDVKNLDEKENHEVRSLDAEKIKYSLIGEFFSSTKLSKFIECEKVFNILNKNEYSNLLKDIVSGKEKIVTEEIKYDKNLANEVKDSKNSFYIIPINSVNNMHWICLIYFEKENTYCILNSAGDCWGEITAKKQYKVRNGQCGYCCRGINNLDELKKVWKDIQTNKKDYAFEFGKWSNKAKPMKLYNEFIERRLREEEDEENVKKLKKLKKRGEVIPKSNLIFDYNKSKFNIVKVTIEEKEDDKQLV